MGRGDGPRVRSHRLLPQQSALRLPGTARIPRPADRPQRQHREFDRAARPFRGPRPADPLALDRTVRLDRAGPGPVALGHGQPVDEQPAGALPPTARLPGWGTLELLVRQRRPAATTELASA